MWYDPSQYQLTPMHMIRSFWLRLLLLLAVFYTVERFCHQQTKGFRVDNIYSNTPIPSEWTTAPPDPLLEQDLRKVFSQPFTFLGDGGQSYSFLSQDGTTVLKFFKYHHMRVPGIFHLLPFSSWKTSYEERCKERLNRTLYSYLLAYKELQQETGLIYLHLNRSSFWNQSIQLIDNIGIAHKIPLDQVEFAVQKKAELSLKDLKRTLLHARREKSEQLIQDILFFIHSRAQKEIKDHDTGLKRNFGVVEGKLVQIDIGSFSHEPSLKNKKVMEEELRKKTKRLARILTKKSPDLLAYYENLIEKLSNAHDPDPS